MIVRNEAHVVERCLSSVRSLIDSYVVVDTGSTDGTPDVVRSALADLPGSVVERPWRDFASNRSEAMDLARPRGEFLLIIDADDVLDLPSGFVLPTLEADGYTIEVADRGSRFRRVQIVRSAAPWRYVGVLHEFLQCAGDPVIGALPITIRRGHDGARRRDARTFRRDVALLEAALATERDPFMRSRYTFYLAQSYQDACQPEKALHHYLARAEMWFWDQEIFVALLRAGRLMEELGRDVDAILATYRRASSVCPTRAEAAHGASRLCRLVERFGDGCAAAEPALALRSPDDGLFIETWIYDYGLRDEYAVNAFGAGSYRDCLAHCLDVLALGDLPNDDRARIAHNARLALSRLA